MSASTARDWKTSWQNKGLRLELLTTGHPEMAQDLAALMNFVNGEANRMAHLFDPEENETRAIHDLVTFAGKDVLEVGSGEGRLTWRFGQQATSILALDLNEIRIKDALDNTPDALRSKVVFEVADITLVELAEAAFDVAVLSWSL